MAKIEENRREYPEKGQRISPPSANYDVIGQNWSRGLCPTPPGYRVKNFTRKKFKVKKKMRQNLVCVQPPPPLKQNRVGGGGGGAALSDCLFTYFLREKCGQRSIFIN